MISQLRQAVIDANSREHEEVDSVLRAIELGTEARLPKPFFRSAKSRLIGSSVGTETDIPVVHQLLFDEAVKISLNAWPQKRWEAHYGLSVDMAVELTKHGVLLPVLRSSDPLQWSEEHRYMQPLIEKSVSSRIRYQGYLTATLGRSVDLPTLERKIADRVTETVNESVFPEVASWDSPDNIESYRRIITLRLTWISALHPDIGMELWGELGTEPAKALKVIRVLYENEIMPEHTAMGGIVSIDRTSRALFGVPELDVSTRRDLALVPEPLRKAIVENLAKVEKWPYNVFELPEGWRERNRLIDRLIKIHDPEYTNVKKDFRKNFAAVMEDIEKGVITADKVAKLINGHNQIAQTMKSDGARFDAATKTITWWAISQLPKAELALGTLGAFALRGLETEIHEKLAKWNVSLKSTTHRLIHTLEEWPN